MVGEDGEINAVYGTIRIKIVRRIARSICSCKEVGIYIIDSAIMIEISNRV